MKNGYRYCRIGLLSMALCCEMAASVHAQALQIAVVETNAETVFAIARQSDERAEVQRLYYETAKLFDEGRYESAIPLTARLLIIRERRLGPKHPEVAQLLNNLGLLYFKISDYEKAKPLYQRSLAIREEVLGLQHPAVAESLNNLAELYRETGDYARAEPLYQRALAIYERSPGAHQPELATLLNNLAVLYDTKRDYPKAELLYKQALAIRERVLGPRDSLVAQSLNNLAELYRAKSDYEKAEPLYQRALAIDEIALGPRHPDVATLLNNLAELYRDKGNYAKAEPLYQRALAIDRMALPPDHPQIATFLNNLAGLYYKMGDYRRAEPLYQQALAIYEKAYGLEHIEVAESLNNLAELYRKKGDYAKAELLYQRALAIDEKVLEPNHPEMAMFLNNLAILYYIKRDVTRLVPIKARANQISERNIALNLAIGSERDKLIYLATLSGETDATVSLHVQYAPTYPAARRLALLTILQRKGRVLDSMVDIISTLSRRLNPQDRALLNELTGMRSQLATLVLGGLGRANPAQYKAEIKRLEDQLQRLEARISRLSAEYRAASQPVTLEAIQAAIPSGAALIEFMSYSPYNAKEDRWEAQRYVVYVTSNQGDIKWADLGEAAPIDEAVSQLRGVLRKNENKPLSDIYSEVKPRARALDRLVMEPVRKLLGSTRQLLVAPDGALNLVPFQALVDESNRYLIEGYSISYLTTGSDLLRLQTPMPSAQGALIFANPNFGGDMSDCSNRKVTVGRGAIDFSRVFFCPLSGTADEANALKTILPAAKVATKEQATEGALKQVAGPKILHIATHGFFLEDVVINPMREGRGLTIKRPGEPAGPEVIRVENPLLRSGLAMAGANLRKSEVMTALEVAGLNLWGTKLVVLSACDTGVGEVKNGDGVYGLRRALVLAGSQTQVMSLWSVSDTGTRDLMIDYYKALEAGLGRSEALRQVQLKMLASKNQNHPFYWASFIQSGEWANLDGKR